MFSQKTKPLLGTLIRDEQRFPGRVFPRKQKPLLGTLIRDAQLFPGRVFPREQKPLLGTLIREGQLALMCTSEIIHNESMFISDHQ